MSVEEVKATLRDGDLALDHATAAIERIRADLAEAAGLAVATLQDSRNTNAEKARRALAEAVREVDLTLRTIGRAKDHAAAFRTALG
ncbi:hypothetical protein [Micromonospora sp. NPDC048830]|uniref:hypothetical protein n=1 Tax=Micromonospora sp. NPDC048830 TaxID=3364257 RepID=UPI003721116E